MVCAQTSCFDYMNISKGLLSSLENCVLIVSQLSGSEKNTVTIIRDQKYVEELDREFVM